MGKSWHAEIAQICNQPISERGTVVCICVCARAYAHLQVLWEVHLPLSKVSLPTSLGLPRQIPALPQSSPSLSCCKVDPSHLLGHQPGRLWSGEPSEGTEFLPLPLKVGVGGLVGEDNPSGDKGDASQLGTWSIPYGPQGAEMWEVSRYSIWRQPGDSPWLAFRLAV